MPEALAYIDQPRTITAVRDSIGDDNGNDAKILSGCGLISTVGQESGRPRQTTYTLRPSGREIWRKCYR